MTTCDGCGAEWPAEELTRGELDTLWCRMCVGDAEAVDVVELEPRRPVHLRTETVLGRTAFGLLTLPQEVVLDPQVSAVAPRRGGKLPRVERVFSRKRPRLR